MIEVENKTKKKKKFNVLSNIYEREEGKKKKSHFKENKSWEKVMGSRDYVCVICGRVNLWGCINTIK